MLTDIFANRYAAVKLWRAFEEPQRRLVAQSFRILSEQICPFYVDGKETDRGKAFWTDIHDKLATELGVKSLSSPTFSYPWTSHGVTRTHVGLYSIHTVCENWVTMAFDNSVPPDTFIKERLSLVEIAFRKRGDEIAAANANLEKAIVAATKLKPIRPGRMVVSGDAEAGIRAHNATLNSTFKATVDELNTRFQQSGSPLSYHNGFIQMSTDALAQAQIESPFWRLLADSKWKNVDTDMKEALDLRDTGGRDPAWYAARALESTIKIISGEKGWTHVGEKGASNYIDNLVAKKAGFITPWEADSLRAFFAKIRNPFGHGPGDAPMPSLEPAATDWAIEACMSWIKSLIRRM